MELFTRLDEKGKSRLLRILVKRIIINPNGDLYSAEDDKNLQAYYLGGNQVSKADKTRGMMESLIERQEFLLPRTEIEGL